MRSLGVITARGGSKGVRGKNLQLLAGRPLLAYTADAARESRRRSRLIVSTDDPAIREVALGLRLEVPFVRPKELAQDDTLMLPVLQHAVRAMAGQGFHADAVVLLQPTSPLRRGEHIDRAIDLLESTGAESVVTVVEVPHQFNPASVMRLEGERLKPFVDGPLILRRQDKPRAFARNGPAVLVVRTSVLERGSLYGDDCRPLVMSAEESVDVDTAADFELLERLLARSPR
jgi:CMP-N,N'-diacetyllegionaminic acid synthase